jgi:D-arabinose 1-dehydrogenase-like Zn-dependent alcohol dehydrogenase
MWWRYGNPSAYDNTRTAQYNYDKGVYKNNYKVPNAEPKSPDYPPTGKLNLSVASAPIACTGTTTFSDINDPNATFTGKPGTYTLGGL